jgi:dolichyl-phosphate beta-glucosyltransferase
VSTHSHADTDAPARPATLGSLSVVIPAYDAERHLDATLRSVRTWARQHDVATRIIVVDDGSRDATATIAGAAGDGDVQVISNDRNRGKGFSVRRGMLAAEGDWVLCMDADNSTSIEHLDDFAKVAERADVIIGSRRVPGARIVRPQPRLRQAMGRTFPHLVQTLVLPQFQDTQCGFKLFRQSAVRAIFPQQRLEGFAFDVEVLLLAVQAGLRIVERPVRWDNPTTSTLRLGIDPLRMLLELLWCAWRFRGGRATRSPRRARPAPPR